MEDVSGSEGCSNEDVNVMRFTSRRDVRVLVCGCGGAGANILTYIHRQKISKVKTVAISTDAIHIDNIECDMKLLIGQEITLGRGCEGDEYVGKMCARTHWEDLRDLVKDSDIVIIISALGGGTGGPVTNELAKVCRGMGIPTFGILIFPFAAEGKRMERAKAMYKTLKLHLDCVVKAYNDWLLHVAPHMSVHKAFNMISSAVAVVVRKIADYILTMKHIREHEFIESIMANHVSVLTVTEGYIPDATNVFIEDKLSPDVYSCDAVHVHVNTRNDLHPETEDYIRRQIKNVTPIATISSSYNDKNKDDEKDNFKIYSVKHEKGESTRQSTLLDMIWHQRR